MSVTYTLFTFWRQCEICKYDTNWKSNTVLVCYMLVNEYKPEFQYRKSPKNAEFRQCLNLRACLCYRAKPICKTDLTSTLKEALGNLLLKWLESGSKRNDISEIRWQQQSTIDYLKLCIFNYFNWLLLHLLHKIFWVLDVFVRILRNMEAFVLSISSNRRNFPRNN